MMIVPNWANQSSLFPTAIFHTALCGKSYIIRFWKFANIPTPKSCFVRHVLRWRQVHNWLLLRSRGTVGNFHFAVHPNKSMSEWHDLNQGLKHWLTSSIQYPLEGRYERTAQANAKPQELKPISRQSRWQLDQPQLKYRTDHPSISIRSSVVNPKFLYVNDLKDLWPRPHTLRNSPRLEVWKNIWALVTWHICVWEKWVLKRCIPDARILYNVI